MLRPVMRGRRGFTVLGFDPTGTLMTRHIAGIVDVLGRGAQKLIPPTIHPNGQPFEWLADPLNQTPPEGLRKIPADIADRLAAALGHYDKQLNRVRTTTGTPAPLNISTRYIERQLRYVETILFRELTGLALMARDSGRNHAVFRLACRVGRWVHHGIISHDRFVADLLDACERNGLVRDDGRRAVLATIASGLATSAGDALSDLGGVP